MTKATAEIKGNIFKFKTEGHCEHDVCVAVSALVNAIVNFAERFEKEGRCELETKYKKGNVEMKLSFYSGDDKRAFLSGADAILEGMKLYSKNFEKDFEYSGIKI